MRLTGRRSLRLGTKLTVSRRRSREPIFSEAVVDSLDQEGRGVARVDGKVMFIDGALPGELVRVQIHRRKKSFDEAFTIEVLRASEERVMPRCPHFGLCGGCVLQHLDGDAQLRHKQDDLLQKLARIGQVHPQHIGEAIRGPLWGYRRKARLGAKHVPAKGGVLVGFRERRAHLIAQIDECHVLIPQVGMRITALRELLATLDAHADIAQIEVAASEEEVLLILRHLVPLSEPDRDKLSDFAREHQLMIALQSGGPDTVTGLYPASLPLLSYRLDEFGLVLFFSALDFVQVNAAINAVLVREAVAALDPQSGEPVLDLFCGLGNFSLALARRGAMVDGVELGEAMVSRARSNASHNALQSSARFHNGDLFQADIARQFIAQGAAKVLLDPPRSGAEAVVAAIGEAGGAAPQRIVYVSCNPATLARDAGALVNEHGYQMREVRVVDMFPHTNHLEAMAIFERGEQAVCSSITSGP
ncbi:MAG: 23S rRNA (uracil1939-C5)-methyltransferase [Gammaproteobacteria bacterium]|jgi:23S rRNA (uracil1939-C5)-methyltransferase